MSPAPKSIVLLFGPTAVGKTETLVQLFAQQAEIINADSMQVYRSLDIGTAKPSEEIFKILPHHLIDILDPNEQYDVGEFVRQADELILEIEGRGKTPVIAGGTAFYLKHFIYGLPETPAGDQEIRRQLNDSARRQGLDLMMEELERVDPESAERISANDGYRIIRALEVYRATGKPLSSYKKTSQPRHPGRTLLIGLQRSREDLYHRIDQRVEVMFEKGLPGEVSRLLHSGYTFADPGMRGIGYREFAEYEKGCLTLEDTKELIKKNTRHYAKRQITFFKSLSGVSWFDPDSIRAIKAHVLESCRR
jgi:tRNA dimethylallyltransferase